MKKFFLVIFSIFFLQLYSMEPEPKSSINSPIQLVVVSENSFDENEEFKEQLKKLPTPYQETIALLILKKDDEQRQIAHAVYNNSQTVFQSHPQLQTDQILALFSALKLLGHPKKDQVSPHYYNLSQPVRALIEKFKTWPQLYQDEAVLIGIEKDRVSKQPRPEFTHSPLYQFRDLYHEFQILGYDILDPQKSNRLYYTSLEKVEERKKQLMAHKKD